MKRFIDISVSFFGIILTSPLFLLIAIAIKLDSPGPIFYKANRVGKNGKHFKLFKFRSMIANADKVGPPITTKEDARISRTGKFLRDSKIDELPQLINVLLGDMSLVGPRPECPRYVALYSPEQKKVLSVRPGITGAASIAYRNEEKLLSGDDWETIYREQIMPAKLNRELDYLDRASIITDLKLIMQTIAVLFTDLYIKNGVRHFFNRRNSQ